MKGKVIIIISVLFLLVIVGYFIYNKYSIMKNTEKFNNVLKSFLKYILIKQGGTPDLIDENTILLMTMNNFSKCISPILQTNFGGDRKYNQFLDKTLKALNEPESENNQENNKIITEFSNVIEFIVDNKGKEQCPTVIDEFSKKVDEIIK